MSSDQLIPAGLERAVLAVLTGRPPAEEAAAARVTVENLVDAVECYRTAGLAALQDSAGRRGWLQVRVEFTDYARAADVIGGQLLPELRRAEDRGVLRSWWYVRKAPHWRLRFDAGPGRDTEMRALIGRKLDELTERGVLAGWSTGVYEPESAAFGGPEGMAIAHRFFHADSAWALTYLTNRRRDPGAAAGPSPRELSLLLCTKLLRAAGQDWHEQGDVWQRVADVRPLPSGRHPDELAGAAAKTQVLLSVDTDPSALADPLASHRPWLATITETGTALARCAGRDMLHRGLRDVLAHHVIFHWNRLGLPAATQAVLAHAAARAILGDIGYGRSDVART